VGAQTECTKGASDRIEFGFQGRMEDGWKPIILVHRSPPAPPRSCHTSPSSCFRMGPSAGPPPSPAGSCAGGPGGAAGGACTGNIRTHTLLALWQSQTS